ncbi:APC family, aromatic amino acid transporter [Salmonella enterica subsp. enterica]|uniref:APC family, aromatic amino acid transporter n=1 Tax=Salmonella enterica I TaxID=59201 RepID=A0A379WFR3_SALET|nr:APC family, aromatic amino acid transporter [Salmonella enterica subsp. enterica]
MDSQQHGEQLKRGLKNRHIQLIALGGAIGTGLFLEAPPLFSRRARNYPGLCDCRLYCLSDYAPAGGDGG